MDANLNFEVRISSSVIYRNIRDHHLTINKLLTRITETSLTVQVPEI